MQLTNERDHIRNAYEITEDIHMLANANIKKGDCIKIDDAKGLKSARYDEQHRAFVLFADVVDYIRDCDIITTDNRQKLVELFYDILDEQKSNQ